MFFPCYDTLNYCDSEFCCIASFKILKKGPISAYLDSSFPHKEINAPIFVFILTKMCLLKRLKVHLSVIA